MNREQIRRLSVSFRLKTRVLDMTTVNQLTEFLLLDAHDPLSPPIEFGYDDVDPATIHDYEEKLSQYVVDPKNQVLKLSVMDSGTGVCCLVTIVSADLISQRNTRYRMD